MKKKNSITIREMTRTQVAAKELYIYIFIYNSGISNLSVVLRNVIVFSSIEVFML